MTSLPKSGGQGDTSKTTNSKKSPPNLTHTRAKTKGQTSKERHTPTEQQKSSASRKLELSNNNSQTAVKDNTKSRDADETMHKILPETPRRLYAQTKVKQHHIFFGDTVLEVAERNMRVMEIKYFEFYCKLYYFDEYFELKMNL